MSETREKRPRRRFDDAGAALVHVVVVPDDGSRISVFVAPGLSREALRRELIWRTNTALNKEARRFQRQHPEDPELPDYLTAVLLSDTFFEWSSPDWSYADDAEFQPYADGTEFRPYNDSALHFRARAAEKIPALPSSLGKLIGAYVPPAAERVMRTSADPREMVRVLCAYMYAAYATVRADIDTRFRFLFHYSSAYAIALEIKRTPGLKFIWLRRHITVDSEHADRDHAAFSILAHKLCPSGRMSEGGMASFSVSRVARASEPISLADMQLRLADRHSITILTDAHDSHVTLPNVLLALACSPGHFAQRVEIPAGAVAPRVELAARLEHDKLTPSVRAPPSDYFDYCVQQSFLTGERAVVPMTSGFVRQLALKPLRWHSWQLVIADERDADKRFFGPISLEHHLAYDTIQLVVDREWSSRVQLARALGRHSPNPAQHRHRRHGRGRAGVDEHVALFRRVPRSRGVEKRRVRRERRACARARDANAQASHRIVSRVGNLQSLHVRVHINGPRRAQH